jgi:hypothetical protein
MASVKANKQTKFKIDGCVASVAAVFDGQVQESDKNQCKMNLSHKRPLLKRVEENQSEREKIYLAFETRIRRKTHCSSYLVNTDLADWVQLFRGLIEKGTSSINANQESPTFLHN